jgi:hypothetical protein
MEATMEGFIKKKLSSYDNWLATWRLNHDGKRPNMQYCLERFKEFEALDKEKERRENRRKKYIESIKRGKQWS